MTPSFDLTSPRMVLAGTVYGEARGGGASGMADVASVVMNRRSGGWDHSTVVGVCLAPLQFSCWNGNDPNRAEILAAPVRDPETWAGALAVADAALAGAPDHTLGADSYFAVSIRPPYWAKAPAVHTVTRWEHSFWCTRPGRPQATVSAHAAAAVAADPDTDTDEADAMMNQYNQPGV